MRSRYIELVYVVVTTDKLLNRLKLTAYNDLVVKSQWQCNGIAMALVSTPHTLKIDVPPTPSY